MQSHNTDSDSDEMRSRLAALLQEQLRLETAMVAAIHDLSLHQYQQALDGAAVVLKEEPDNVKATETAEFARKGLEGTIGIDETGQR